MTLTKKFLIIQIMVLIRKKSETSYIVISSIAVETSYIVISSIAVISFVTLKFPKIDFDLEKIEILNKSI